jgi:predicted DCC family thiol-disulfide oxidoreductase YuxK
LNFELSTFYFSLSTFNFPLLHPSGACNALIDVGSANHLRVYNDGRCPFCQWVQQMITRWDRDHRLVFRDYHDPAAAAETPFPFEQLHQRMHVQTPDGWWHTGFFGWIAVLRVLPRWRLLASVMNLPPVRWIGPSIYRFIANRRYGIAGTILGLLGAPRPCKQSCETSRQLH